MFLLHHAKQTKIKKPNATFRSITHVARMRISMQQACLEELH
uniref:Uncharacterized protein n=1 Tax=Arundo donax TaxID=35708 RepID=A0A0A9CT03_ARUDO